MTRGAGRQAPPHAQRLGSRWAALGHPATRERLRADGSGGAHGRRGREGRAGRSRARHGRARTFER
eukprot:1270662-Pyramimonas_sp.AAC.1